MLDQGCLLDERLSRSTHRRARICQPEGQDLPRMNQGFEAGVAVSDEGSMASSSALRSRHRGLRCMQLYVLAGIHCLAIGSGCGRDGDAADTPAPFLVSEQLDRFQLTDSYARERSRFAVWRGVTGPERVLQQELRTDVDAAQAAQLLADEIMRLEAVYADAVSPYPGQISNQITSTGRLLPKRYQRMQGG